MDGGGWRLIKINPSYLELLQALVRLPKPGAAGEAPKSTVIVLGIRKVL